MKEQAFMEDKTTYEVVKEYREELWRVVWQEYNCMLFEGVNESLNPK